MNVGVDDAVSALASDPTATRDGVISVTPRKLASYDSVTALHSYQIKPTLKDKFKATPVKEIIRRVLTAKLTGKKYDTAEAKTLSVTIANTINTQVRALKMKRYKHIVQVIMCELKGAGIKGGVRCLWDSETDGYTSDTFRNETIFCTVVVFAVYLY